MCINDDLRQVTIQGGRHPPASLLGTWVADFMLKEDAGMFMLGKYLSDEKNPCLIIIAFIT